MAREAWEIQRALAAFCKLVKVDVLAVSAVWAKRGPEMVRSCIKTWFPRASTREFERTVMVGIEPKASAVKPIMNPARKDPVQVTTKDGVPAKKAAWMSEGAAFQAREPVTSTPERARSNDPLTGAAEKVRVCTG
jgi:hypothetical protein